MAIVLSSDEESNEVDVRHRSRSPRPCGEQHDQASRRWHRRQDVASFSTRIRSSSRGNEVDNLGMSARTVYYYVCYKNRLMGLRCSACAQPLSHRHTPSSVSNDSDYISRPDLLELCIGFKRPCLSVPCWIHASRHCIMQVGIPSVPRGRILFSPNVRAHTRNYVLSALSLRSLSREALASGLSGVTPWRYTPAIVQYWANDGQPYGPLGTRVQDDSTHDRRNRPQRIEDTSEMMWLGSIAPARLLATHEATEDLCCAICHDAVNVGSVVRRLPCGHVFHDACILPWLRLHPFCPLDRQRVDEMPPL
eukprot:TRINITY_DN77364_c0_g1_i1.p1 TRINITY_DN77364_c0_g1~~TRINITY_DN77364_c0_g1_i1.p1  ORF type:complete len:320 (-),score=-7.97 TRINITY_DN77364_c0_g1_i1:67-987(-)